MSSANSARTHRNDAAVYVITIDGTQSAIASYRQTVTGANATSGADSNILAGFSQSTLTYRMAITTPAFGQQVRHDNVFAVARSHCSRSPRQDLSYDAGFVEAFGLGDFVWFDSNADGVQSTGETGIGGVNVTLYTDASCVS